jgi:hypothetical protein
MRVDVVDDVVDEERHRGIASQPRLFWGLRSSD